MAYRWIKLYIEVLDDYKMARLPDHLWRMAIELFLLAGEHGRDGSLGDIPEIAWRLRVGEEDMTESLHALQTVGIVQQDGDIWIVTKFAERQAAESVTDRVASHRKRETKRDSNEDVTNRYETSNEDVTKSYQNRIDKNRIDKNRIESVQHVAERLTGLLATPADILTLNAWERDGITEDDIRDALQWRVDNGRPPAKTIAQLAGGVSTSHSKRIQGNNARASPNGKSTTGIKSTGAIAKRRKELERGDTDGDT